MIEVNEYKWKEYTIQVHFDSEDKEWENCEVFVLDDNNQLKPITMFSEIPEDFIDYISFMEEGETIETTYGEIQMVGNYSGESKQREFKFKVSEETKELLKTVIEENWDGECDSNRTYELIGETIENTLKDNKGNGFNFNGFYLKDVYLVNNWLDIQKINERTLEDILKEPQNLLKYILVNRCSPLISESENNGEYFILRN